MQQHWLGKQRRRARSARPNCAANDPPQSSNILASFQAMTCWHGNSGRGSVLRCCWKAKMPSSESATSEQEPLLERGAAGPRTQIISCYSCSARPWALGVCELFQPVKGSALAQAELRWPQRAAPPQRSPASCRCQTWAPVQMDFPLGRPIGFTTPSA